MRGDINRSNVFVQFPSSEMRCFQLDSVGFENVGDLRRSLCPSGFQDSFFTSSGRVVDDEVKLSELGEEDVELQMHFRQRGGGLLFCFGKKKSKDKDDKDDNKKKDDEGPSNKNDDKPAPAAAASQPSKDTAAQPQAAAAGGSAGQQATETTAATTATEPRLTDDSLAPGTLTTPGEGDQPLGVTIQVLRDLSNRLPREGMKTREVCEVVCDETRDRKSSLASKFSNFGEEGIGQANWFVSHAWDSEWGETVDALEGLIEHKQLNEESTFFFLDVVCLNQHALPPITTDGLEKTLKTQINDLTHAVFVLDSYSNPQSLTRTWCLWELVAAMDLENSCGLEITFALPRDQHAQLVEQLKVDSSGVVTSLAAVNSAQSGCCFPSDRSVLVDALEGGGLKDTDEKVTRRVKLWLRDAARALLPEDQNVGGEENYQASKQAAEQFEEEGDQEQALREYLKALSAAESFGPFNYRVAAILNALAELLQSLGRYDEALGYYQRALKIDQEVYGEEHMNVAGDLNSIAEVLMLQKKYEEALPWLFKAMAVDEKVDGPEDPSVAIDLQHIVECLKALKRYDEALPHCRRMLEIDEKAYGEVHETVAVRVEMLAGLLKQLGETEEAEELYERAVEINRQLHGDNHPSMANHLNNKALLLQQQRKFDEALPLFEKSLAISEQVYGEDHPLLAAHLNNTALVLRALERYDESIAHFERSLKICEDKMGADHPNTSNIRANVKHTKDLKQFKQENPNDD